MISHSHSHPGAGNTSRILHPHDRTPSATIAFVRTTGNVFDVLEAHVVSPWHLLSSICAWQNMDPLALTADDVLVLAPLLGSQVARVTDAEHGLHLTQALQALAQSAIAT